MVTVTPGTLTTGASLSEARCGVSEAGGVAFAPLLAPLIGIAVDAAVNVVSDQLAKAKAGRTAAWPAVIGGVPLEKGEYCLAISRGVITSAGDPGRDTLELGGKAAFAGTPAFVLLASLSIVPSTTGYNMRITPKFLSYAETSAPKRGSGKKDVSVLLAFDGSAPAPTAAAAGPSDAGGGALAKGATGGVGAAGSSDAGSGASVPDGKKGTAGVQLALGRLVIGRSYNQALLSTVVAQTSITAAPMYTVSAVVTESEDPSVTLTAFAAAFDKNKDSLSTALQTAIKDALGVKAAK